MIITAAGYRTTDRRKREEENKAPSRSKEVYD